MPPTSKWVVLVIAAVAGVPAAAQRFETGATAVIVDVVVRDKSGRQVTDLTPADFTLSEDGVAQRITSVRLVGEPSAPASPSAPALPASGSALAPATAVAAAPDQPRFTALIFDRLETENINIARAGATAAIANAGRNDVIGVFLVDISLVMVQPFTSDKARLAAAVDNAVQWSAGLITRDAGGKRFDGGGVPAQIELGLQGSDPRFGMAVLQSRDMLERQFQGHYTLNALHTATAALSTLPGSKTLIYFSDAIALPDRVLSRLRDVIATANSGQVTIYSVDTGGLRVGSQESATSSEIAAIGRSGLAVNADGGSSSSLKMMERNEDALRRAPRVGLTMLSRPTGGFLIDSTNDLAAGVRRIDADRRTHYLLTYQPARTELDGTWRTIDVKVERRDTTVQARQGYVAVKSPGVLPVLVFEGPALAAIDHTPAPRNIATRVGAFAFPRADGSPTQDVAVVVAAPAETLTFETKGSSYRTDFTMLALVRDADGEPIHKTSQPYRLTGPAVDRTRAMNGEVRFARTLPMTPGTYTAFGSVQDALSGRAGVNRWPLAVDPRGPSGLGVSSLVLLSRMERVPSDATATAGDPLVIGDRIITPNLGEFIYRQPGAKLGFYVTIAGASPGERLQARLQILPDGVPEPKAILVDAPVTLEAADARGMTRLLGQLPIGALPSQSFELRLTVERTGQTDVRRAFFHLADPTAAKRPPAS